MKKIFHTSLYVIIGWISFSCGSYRQNIMFNIPEGYALDQQVEQVEKNYRIQKNDYLELKVYTNKGERIIDPNFEAFKENAAQGISTKTEVMYLVDINGVVKFPMLGELKVENLTIRQAEEILQKEYTKYYQEPFVILKYTNKRVIVLGAPGGQVLPLLNENIRLTEVLAMARGIDNNAKAHNIRVLRDKQVFRIDLSTIQGYLNDNMIILPGDIVYIEPVRRPLLEGLKDYLSIVGIATSLTTLILVFTK